MILDNARMHNTKLIQPFLNEVKDGLKLIFCHYIVQNSI